MISALVAEPRSDGSTKAGEEHDTFGAFIEILPGVEGLLHISELHTAGPRRPRTS